MRVLVIGGAGFIGPPVVSGLQQGGHVVATLGRRAEADRPGLVHIVGDRRELTPAAPAIRAFAPDVVVDLILSSGKQARELAGIVRGVAPRIVAASSMDVYRACAVLHRLEEGPIEPVPLTEDSALRTRLQTYPAQQVHALQSLFGWLDDEYDKIPVEREILGQPDIAGTVLRLPIVYGPGDRLHRLRPMLSHMDAGVEDYAMPASIARWRGPRGFVDNVAHAIVRATLDPRAAGRVYNVAEPENFSEEAWAATVAAAIGWSGRIVVVPDAAAPPNPLLAGNLEQHWAADSSRIRDELGYAEVVRVADGIRRTAEWERGSALPAHRRTSEVSGR